MLRGIRSYSHLETYLKDTRLGFLLACLHDSFICKVYGFGLWHITKCNNHWPCCCLLQDYKVRVYSRSRDPSIVDAIREAFRLWIKNFNRSQAGATRLQLCTPMKPRSGCSARALRGAGPGVQALTGAMPAAAPTAAACVVGHGRAGGLPNGAAAAAGRRAAAAAAVEATGAAAGNGRQQPGECIEEELEEEGGSQPPSRKRQRNLEEQFAGSIAERKGKQEQ